MSLQIRRLSHALGAEIIGIDLQKPLDDECFTEIHSAFLEHCILLFRGRPLTREQHVAFSRRFGELDQIPDFRIKLGYRDAGYPEILLVTNRPKPGKQFKYNGDVWHSDQANTLIPAMASLLRGVEVPEIGGDTMFANMYLVYETLSEGMKKLLDGLYGVFVGTGKRIDDSTPERLAETKRRSQAAQPLVRVHPETGRKSLYLSEKVKLIAGMSAEESKPLIQFLCQHAARPQFVYRHRWQKDDLIMWDNRCTNHIAVNDYDQTRIRHMERTTVIGTPSGYAYDGPLQ